MQISTFDKWKRDMDKNYSTLTWLCCEVDKKNRSLVSSMFCKVCREYEDRIVSLRNFSPVWINGSYNHRTNSIVDHLKVISTKPLWITCIMLLLKLEISL